MSFTLLVLDDEPWHLSWVKDLVEPKGGKCVFADTYETAKTAFDKDKPEIVIVDIRIGDVDEPVQGATLKGIDPSWVGLRFLSFIRADRRSASTKLFVYTGLDREGVQRVAENAYQAAFFTKYDSADFEAALRSAIAKISGK